MKIYLINILLIFLYAYLFLYSSRHKNKKLFCALASFNWILISGLRHISVGADTLTYKLNFFDYTMYNSWRYVLNNFVDVYFRGFEGKDPGYMIFEKLVQIFTTNYQVYILIIAIVFTVPLGRWIYKNSSDPFISFLIYSTLFYAFFAVTGHRQTIATALVVLIGYDFIIERRFRPFLLLMAIAFTIHKSSLVFLPFYFMANKTITNRYLISAVVITILVFIFKNQVIMVLGSFSGYGSYIQQYGGPSTRTFASFLIIIFVVIMLRYSKIIENNKQATNYINALILAVWLVPLTFIVSSTMRVVQYYSVFILLLIPEIIKSFPKKEKIIVYYISVSTLLLLYIRNNAYYMFFWQ